MSTGIYKTRVGGRRVFRVPASLVRERERLEKAVAPDARQMFELARPRMLASRPQEMMPHPHFKDRRGRPLWVPVYGAPTFRNRIDEKGAWV